MLENTFTHAEYEQNKRTKPQAIRFEQARATWLGHRLTNLRNDDLSSRGLMINVLNAMLSSTEVDWKNSNNNYGAVPATCEMAALVEAVELLQKTMKDLS